VVQHAPASGGGGRARTRIAAARGKALHGAGTLAYVQGDYAQAALQGSSFYKLPRILQWFSGNIGFHHIHHLSPRIPNYHLERCHKAEPLFQKVKPVTLSTSLKSFAFRLWDEQRNKLVGFRALKALRLERATASARSTRQGNTESFTSGPH